MQLSIIIPAYNESLRIGPTLERILVYRSEQNLDAEIIVVDDGSTDDTGAIAQACARRHRDFRVLSNGTNRGKGYSVQRGMLEATGVVRLMSDADLSSPIEEAPKLMRAIADGADIAIGSRWLDPQTQTKRQSVARQMASHAAHKFIRIMVGIHERDPQCGFKAFTKSAVDTLFPFVTRRWMWDTEILFLAHRIGLRVTEVPVAWAHCEGSHHGLKATLWDPVEVVVIRCNHVLGAYRKLTAGSRAPHSDRKMAS
jgi:glycosyltransferase involved in cell wall biosynthesis